LAPEITGDTYRGLLEATLVDGKSASVVVRPSLERSSHLDEALKGLVPLVLEHLEVSEWPGTRLLRGTGLLTRFRWERGAVAWALGLTDSLSDWRQPGLPEDLCIYRADGTALLASIAHERDAFMLLSLEESRALLEATPGIVGLLSQDRG